MLEIVCQEERSVMDHEKIAISDFGVAERGDEFHWDSNELKIDVSDLECEPLMISDLNHDLDFAMRSTVHD